MLGFTLWILQILTALFLFIGLYIHAFVSPLPNVVFNILFICAAVFHGFNGIWGIIDESLRKQGWKIAGRFSRLVSDYSHNRQSGHLLFIIHRITGIFIFLFLAQHIVTNYYVSAYINPGSSPLIEFLRHDWIKYLALLSLGFHAMNGIRLIFIELTGFTLLQKKLAYVSLVTGLLFAAYVTLQYVKV
jgi:succinate dehydrogenase/fumarate reductase cytochrome b subunit